MCQVGAVAVAKRKPKPPTRLTPRAREIVTLVINSAALGAFSPSVLTVPHSAPGIPDLSHPHAERSNSAALGAWVRHPATVSLQCLPIRRSCGCCRA
jgi:hypothetical protein